MKLPQIFIIGDTHFNHEAMEKLCGRPKNHTELTIENWRRAVRPCDTTFHLGDVIFNRAGELKILLDSISGRKILVRGNHDTRSLHWYLSHGFDFACDSFTYGDLYFTHIPALSLPVGCSVNIHGHLHNTGHREHKAEIWHRLFCLENVGYRPVELTEFLKR